MDCPLERYVELTKETLEKFVQNDERERNFDILKIIEASYREVIQ